MARLAVLGPLNVDLIVHGKAPLDGLATWVGTSTVTTCMAGAVGYFIGAARMLGHEVSAISTVGDDPLGRMVLDTLDRTGVDRRFVDVQHGTSTAIAIYMLLFGDKKRPLTYQLPSHDLWPLHFTTAHASAIDQADWFHHGGYLHFPPSWNGPVHDAFKHAKDAGKMTSLDPQFPLKDLAVPWIHALGGLLRHVDVLFVDALEARSLTGLEGIKDAGHALRNEGPGIVVVKRGEQGSIAFHEGGETICPAVKIEESEIIDAIGAGDTFDAGFVDACMHGVSTENALMHASLTAASTLRCPGGHMQRTPKSAGPGA